MIENVRRGVTVCLSLAILLGAVPLLAGRDKNASNEKGASNEKISASEKPASGSSQKGKTEASVDKYDKASKPQKKSKKIPGFTGEREAAAMTFVRANHPELADLLDQLKTTDPSQYQKAIRDLFKSSERLAQLEERSPQRYPLELSMWKVNSRIQVLLAKLAMSPDPGVEDQLRACIAEQLDLRKQLLNEDVHRLEQRLAEVKADIDDLDQHSGERIEQKMARLLSEASKSRPLVKRSSQSKRASNDKPKREKTSADRE